MYGALHTRVTLRRFRQLGPGARVVGTVWAPAWRGAVRAGRDLLIDASSAPVELHALEGGEIRIGDGVEIDSGASIEAQALVSIGNGVRIGPRCKIFDNDFHTATEFRSKPWSRPVVIEDGARIGADVLILPGSTIPAGARIPDGAVIQRAYGARGRAPVPPAEVPRWPHDLLYRGVDRAWAVLSVARAPFVLRGCLRGDRVEAGAVRVVGGRRVRIGGRAIFARGMLPTELIAHPRGRVTIGARTEFNYGSRVESWSEVRIGESCHVGSRVRICDGGPEGAAPITIGDGVWIAYGASIGPGVTIGAGCVVGAGVVVSRDAPPESLVIGSPARMISLALLRAAKPGTNRVSGGGPIGASRTEARPPLDAVGA